MIIILQTLQNNIECFDRYAKLTIFVRNNTLLAQINRSSAQDICNSVFAQEATLQVNVGGMVYSKVLQMSQTESQFLIPIIIPGGDMTTVQTLKQANYQITFGQQFTFSGTFQEMVVDLVDSRECWSIVTMNYVKDYKLIFSLTPNTCVIASDVQLFLESSLDGQTWKSIFVRNINDFVLSTFTSITIDSSLLDSNTTTYLAKFVSGLKQNFNTTIRLKLVEIDPDFEMIYFAKVQTISNPISLSILPLPVTSMTSNFIFTSFSTLKVYNYFQTYPETKKIIGIIVIYQNGSYYTQNKFSIAKEAFTTRIGIQYRFQIPIQVNSDCQYRFFQLLEGIDSNNMSLVTLTSNGSIWLSCIKHMEIQLKTDQVCLRLQLYDTDLCLAAYPITFDTNFNLLKDPDLSDPTKRTTFVWFNFTHPIENVFSQIETWCFDETYEINKVQGVAAVGSFESRIKQFFEVFKHSQYLSISKNAVEFFNIKIVTSVDIEEMNKIMWGTIIGVLLIVSGAIITALVNMQQQN
ncbi:Conserved_hypothetical protein [Hexamita inflata]|uniref:Transmembrane protein n=1 Tax=Hexamita inflata TaxID=28002 RepID=A0AA86NGH1_9EUKA|nr:Conserved hypothetical protein [Hexamita inflata]